MKYHREKREIQPVAHVKAARKLLSVGNNVSAPFCWHRQVGKKARSIPRQMRLYLVLRCYSEKKHLISVLESVRIRVAKYHVSLSVSRDSRRGEGVVIVL